MPDALTEVTASARTARRIQMVILRLSIRCRPNDLLLSRERRVRFAKESNAIAARPAYAQGFGEARRSNLGFSRNRS